MFFHRRQLRRWAARVLLAWLCGVVAGVANACVLAVAPPAGAAGEARAHQASAHERAVHAEPADGDGGSAELAACEAFCDQSSVAVPTTSAPLEKADLATALPASMVPLPPAWRGAIAGWAMHEWRAAALPIPITLLRLAL